MKTVPADVRDRHGNPITGATVIICPHCDNDAFSIFIIPPGHQHLQCDNCGNSFCDGSCVNEVKL